MIVEEQEFAESKKASKDNEAANYQSEEIGDDTGDGFMNILDDMDGTLPFD